MSKNYYKLPCILSILTAVFLCGNVSAQELFDENPENRQQVSVKLPEIEFGQDNDYYSSILALQKQIALIKKLKDRESEVNNISKSYDEMAVDFTPPAPERAVCEQIPANKVCHFYYKGMYRNYNPEVGTSEGKLPEIRSVKLPTGKDVAVAPVLDIPKQLSEQTVEEKKILKKSRFAWTRITCLEGNCRAVIAPTGNITDEDGNPIDGVNEKLSYSVRIGDILPSGAVITRISVDGVETLLSGKTDIIGPAPADRKIAEK